MSLSVAETSSEVSRAAHARQKTFPEQVWGWLACFRSVQLAIVLLSLLALATLAGVLLPQEGLVEVAQIKAQFGKNYRLFKAMGLFNVYSSYWFITLEVLFFFSLLIGSFQWLRPAYLAATRQTYCSPEQILASSNQFQLDVAAGSPEQSLAEATQVLKRHRYRVYQKEDRLYATKGNFSRFGPVIAHTGILLLLIASVWGAFVGFKAQKLAVPGTTFELGQVDAFMPNMPTSVWQGGMPDWKVRVEDFRIDYYANQPGMAKQYYADVAILSPEDRVLKRETISVNHPITYQDVTIYQASFAPTGKLFVEINGKPVTLETNTNFQDRPVSMTDIPGSDKALVAFPFFVQQDPNVERNYMVFFLRDKGEGFLGAAPGKMPENLRLMEGESGTLGGITFKYVKPEISTGLQIKYGPEVPLMYLSYLVICVGAFLCIFSQRMLWLALKTDASGARRLVVMFKTNKARLSFLKELKVVYGQLQQANYSQPSPQNLQPIAKEPTS